MTGWRSPRGELPPAPDGPLVVEVTCSTGPRSRNRHPVTLERDWTLTTPHDLEAERILLALGGTLSCVPLNDVVVPALRDLVQLSARRRLAGVRRTTQGRWRVATRSCRRCHGRAFRSPADAARHERSPEHWAALIAPHHAALHRLYDRVGHEHPAVTRRPTGHPLVREVGGLADLYDAGVPPEFVEETHAAVWADGPAMPVAFYLSAAYLLPDLDWLARVAEERPDPDVLTWAAWTESRLDRHRPQARLQWLALGLGVREVTRLMGGGYTVEDAESYAAVTGRSTRRAAQLLAGWQAAECTPGPGDLVALDDAVGDAWEVPSGGAIDLLLHDAGPAGGPVTRTQAGLVLAAAGSRPVAARLLRAGVRDARTAAQHLQESSALTPEMPSPRRPRSRR